MLSLQLLCMRDPLPLPTEPPPLMICGFFSASSTVIRASRFFRIKRLARHRLALAVPRPLTGHRRGFPGPGITAGLYLPPGQKQALCSFAPSKLEAVGFSLHTCKRTDFQAKKLQRRMVKCCFLEYFAIKLSPVSLAEECIILKLSHHVGQALGPAER